MTQSLGLFEGFGVEVEYIAIDATTATVQPIIDRLFLDACGERSSEVERGEITWSNELAAHVVEFKTTDPTPALDGIGSHFCANVLAANEILSRHGARLMPAGAHPFMDPHVETRLWPDGDREIYEAYNRVFDCRGHGWSNLQSIHLNLPFRGDEEFARLHTAIRLLLPVLPALTASSPFLDGQFTGFLDSRLEVYRGNQRKIPSITGDVIPEPVFSEEEYRLTILRPMYAEIRPFDPEGILQEEWLNSRGAIARFDRNTIEIRVMDSQESPVADLAVAAAVVAVVKALCEERWSSGTTQQSVEHLQLVALFEETIRVGGDAPIDDARFLRAFGLTEEPRSVRDLWRSLNARCADRPSPFNRVLQILTDRGSLAERMVEAVGRAPSRRNLQRLCLDLSDTLAEDRLFLPGDASRAGAVPTA